MIALVASGCLERTAQIAGGAVVGAAVGAVVTSAINNWGDDDSDSDNDRDRRDRSERRNQRAEHRNERRNRTQEAYDDQDDSDRYDRRRGSGGGGGEPAAFRGIVGAHNKVRASVGAPDLAWSSSVASQAQSWADELGSRNCEMTHSQSGYGENLAWASGTRLTPSRVVQMWADERQYYDENSNRCSGGVCGHYTQVVWKNTKYVGCGLARCGNAEVWVCNYDPPGNYRGQRPY